MKIAVIGAGSWGTTIASLLAEDSNEVVLWSRREDLAERINTEHKNTDYLGDMELSHSLTATADIGYALDSADLVVLAVPSQFLRSVMESALDHFSPESIYLSLVKGIEVTTLKRPSEIISELVGIDHRQVAVLSGPNHAEEVVRKIPTATVIACADADNARRLQELFMRPYFRVYTNDDVNGVEIAAAVKNVMAIAVGISDGLGFGDNTRAALITRGLAEMLRIGLAYDARGATFLGLAGVGDLIATATSLHSRNRRFGEMLGKGHTAEEIMSSTRMVAEGVRTSLAVQQLARNRGVECPITDEVVEIIYAGKKPEESVLSLMTRAPKQELSGLDF